LRCAAHALGVIRMLMKNLDCRSTFAGSPHSGKGFGHRHRSLPKPPRHAARTSCYERLAAACASRVTRPGSRRGAQPAPDAHRRHSEAPRRRARLLGPADAAQALAAANKRIGNILKKAEGNLPEPDAPLLQEPAEKALFDRVVQLAPLVTSHVANENYAEALKVALSVRAEVDHFFDEVMVNVDEPLIRANRLGLLKALFDQLNAVADISGC
jgi:hypothetical protein